MKIDYSKEADALYIKLRDAKIVDTEDIEEGITVDFDEQGHIVGIEILDAHEKIDKLRWINIGKELVAA
jgi:uncharacterized protein YuzE